jgi:hypothetical protein
MKIAINLASQPFRRDRALVVASPLGVPGEHNAGLPGYLRSVARNN